MNGMIKKSKLSKLLALCLTLAMLFALAACGGNNKGGNNKGGSNAGGNSGGNAGDSGANTPDDGGSDAGSFTGRTLTVGIWGGNDQETAAIEQLKANFEAQYGCTVELKVYTDYNTVIGQRGRPIGVELPQGPEDTLKE